MSISESYTQRLDHDLLTITEPLMQQLRDIDGEIAGMTTELSELRAHRTKLVSIVRSINPELAPKKKNYVGKSLVPISDEKVAGIWGWLKEAVNGDEFYASGLMRMEGVPTSQSQMSKALVVLHERGNIRLVRQGSGGSKYYRVVA
jgi:hypothetical protein